MEQVFLIQRVSNFFSSIAASLLVSLSLTVWTEVVYTTIWIVEVVSHVCFMASFKSFDVGEVSVDTCSHHLYCLAEINFVVLFALY